jgi:hypothetical protein
MRRTFVRRSEPRGVQRRDAEFINGPQHPTKSSIR